MRFGLSEQTIERIGSVFARHPGVQKAVLFGSRAMGTCKPGSDIDLTLFGEDISHREMNRIFEELEELDLPYSVDVSVFSALRHDGLRDHIARVGVVFYARPSGS
jgi:predicted nucleotidyltransferase